MIIFQGLTSPQTTWFHVCPPDIWSYLDLEYDECESCGMTKKKAIKLYPKKNKHLKEQEDE